MSAFEIEECAVRATDRGTPMSAFGREDVVVERV